MTGRVAIGLARHIPGTPRRLAGGVPGVPRLRHLAVDVWFFNAILAATATAIFFGVASRLPQAWSVVHLPVPVLAAMFCAAESVRVYIHFPRNSQSYGLSEMPLVVGLFFATPDELIIARLIGSAIAIGLVRRHPPIKLVFNVAMFVLEAELVTWLFNTFLPHHDMTSPLTWLLVLLIMAAGSMLGFLLSAIVISLAEDSLKRRHWLQPAGIILVGGTTTSSLGLLLVGTVSRQATETLLLLPPILTLVAAYSLYSGEHRKRQQLQHLYETSDMLQRATTEASAIPELLRQLCQVFRTETAAIQLLPSATGTTEACTVRMHRNTQSEGPQPLTLDVLDDIVPLLSDVQRTWTAAARHDDPEVTAWLDRQGTRDAMTTLLRGDDQLLGSLLIGNRLSTVSSFGPDDVSLFETFAAQASVAIQNTRLGSRLKHQAFHDPLTGLANRSLLTDRITHALSRRDAGAGGALAVVFLDLDDFKAVNDSLGHSAGDALLRAVADRLRTVLRPSDTAARFGGDEFAVLIEDVDHSYEAAGVAERIVSILRPHFVVGAREVAVHASVGVAIARSHDVAADELLRRADVAMYRAKTSGKGTYEVFEEGMQEEVTRRLEVKTDLERALARDELVMHYQPIVHMHTGAPVGVEALIRWEHPGWGRVMPGEFIGIAEESGLIYDIGLVALEQACAQCEQWLLDLPDLNPFSVSVNVSPRQLRNPRFVEDVWRILTETGLHPSRLVLEITETFMLEEPIEAAERLRALKLLGVRLSLDDFGTGYSSLAELKHLPFDVLKIDKTFVDHVADDPRSSALAHAIIRLGSTFGLQAVAEGIETAAQAQRLSDLGCELAQGYHYSRPVEAGAIGTLLHSNARRTGMSAGTPVLAIVEPASFG